ncbi:unnamed protein product [Xylocopa violacea]
MLLPVLLLPLVTARSLNLSMDMFIVEFDNGTLEDVQFSGQSNPTELNLSNMGIIHIEKNALDNVPMLKWLNLAKNSLQSLPEFIFSNLTSLEYLSLAENKLNSLEHLFVRLEKLRVLNISYNPMLHLRRGHLFGLTKSATILTDGNVLWSISTGAFSNSFLKDEEELKNLEKIKAQVDVEQSNDATEREIEASKESDVLNLQNLAATSTKLELWDDMKLKLCMLDRIVLSLEPLEQNKSTTCLLIPVNAKQKSVSLRGLGIRGFHEKWYDLSRFRVVSLDLSNNDIVEITKEMLNQLPEDLVFVNLMGNRIRGIWNQVIENRHLRILNLRGNLIEHVEEGALAKTNLTALFLNGNHLENLSFASSLPQTLTELVLSGNLISSISDGAFSTLSRLVYLNLANNRIEKLQDDVFKGLDSLQVLIITRNNLMEIERQAFNNLKQLTTLYLHRNSLRELRKGTFSELESLKDLNLAWNKLEKITVETFAGLSQTLDFLHIDFNEINSLEKGSFINVPRFTLSLTGNKISSIPRGTFNLPTLRDLHLNNNTLTTIDGDSYEGLPQLKRLWLNENQISQIPKGSCKNLASLNILDVSKNPFQKLENGALYGLNLARGHFLYIYNNQLKEIQGGVFEMD